MTIADVSNKPIAELVSLTGRRAVVTGGARGLGKAMGRRLAEAGAAVLLADLDEELARAAASELSQAYGVRVLATALDVADSASVSAAADAAVEQLGGIDIWVNNAGVFPTAPLLEMTDELWDRVLDINLRGSFVGAREAARRMTAAGQGGVIINVASTAGFKGVGPGLAAYVSSKHGVRGLTRQLAVELAPSNIRVLAVAPTFILTEGTGHGKILTEANPNAAKMLPGRLGRAGQPDDIARVVLFCASDLSMFMTGSTLPVDAGDLL
jgi:NAD(P)-dependent dehydrogenase (short-subunit alcohol dehydrogenase family)